MGGDSVFIRDVPSTLALLKILMSVKSAPICNSAKNKLMFF